MLDFLKNEKVINTIVGSLIGGIVTLAITLITYHLSGIGQERDELKQKLEGYRFSEDFYRKIPGDVDLVLRSIKVDLKNGNLISVNALESVDQYILGVSRIEATDAADFGEKIYKVTFYISGMMNTNDIKKMYSTPVDLKAGNIAGPIRLLNHDFYVYIDQTNIEYVKLSIARRKNNLNLRLFGNTFNGNWYHNVAENKDIPKILLSSASD